MRPLRAFRCNVSNCRPYKKYRCNSTAWAVRIEENLSGHPLQLHRFIAIFCILRLKVDLEQGTISFSSPNFNSVAFRGTLNVEIFIEGLTPDPVLTLFLTLGIFTSEGI